MAGASPRLRKILLLQALYGVADVEMQRRAWFGSGPEVSSPDEAVNQFYDADVRGHLLSRELGDTATALLSEMVGAMDGFCAATPESLVAAEVMNDVRWDGIRRLAANLIAELEGPGALLKEPINV